MTEPTQCPCEFCEHCVFKNVPRPEPLDTTFVHAQEFFGELPRTPPTTPKSPPRLQRHNAAPCKKLREMIAALNVFK
jgi:hypothetical protein